MNMQYQRQTNIKKKEISEIDRLSKGLEDYIVLQDGHIVTKKVSSAFDDLVVLSYDEALKTFPALFNELVNVKHPTSDAYQIILMNAIVDCFYIYQKRKESRNRYIYSMLRRQKSLLIIP